MYSAEESYNVAVVRRGFESAQAQELVSKLGEECYPEMGAGWVAYRANRKVPPLIFERQRLVNAHFIPDEDLMPLPDAVLEDILQPIIEACHAWTVHPYGLGEEEGLERRARGINGVILRYAKKNYPLQLKRMVEETPEEGWVLQLALGSKGLWYAAQEVDTLVAAAPAGIRRMRLDDQSPSRSYLKLEEVFQRMETYPKEGQAAVDLGAAPGGWTYALLKHGCQVVAVDHGDLQDMERRRGITHLKADGMTYKPARKEVPIDWMVSDMLIPPGKAMGLLRTWLRKRWCRYFVVTIKLPQEEPFVPLQPVIDMLRESRNLDWWRMHQLYHNRREVTVWGKLKDL